MVREALSRAASPTMREMRKRRRARRRASPKVRKEGVSGADEQGLMRDLVLAVADSFITFCWVFSGASVAVIANVLAKELGWGNAGKTSILVALALVVLPTFIAVGRWMGGASWNSVGLLALASLGVGHVTFLSVLVRLPAQVMGAVAGAQTMMNLTPPKYKQYIGGPKLKVHPTIGMMVEAVLTYTIALVTLHTRLKGPRNPQMKMLIVVVATITLVRLGARFTGPSMNPGCAFGWAYVNRNYATMEHGLVYWTGPLIGVVAAVNTFVLLFGVTSKMKSM